MNELRITNAVTSTLGPSGNSTSAVAMDLTLCDYVKLRKARMGPRKAKGTVTDKKLQVVI